MEMSKLSDNAITQNTTTKEDRGKVIANQSSQIKQVKEHLFKVQSQSKNRFYDVRETDYGMTCTCPDFINRGGRCKHIIATKFYLEVQKESPNDTTAEKIHLTYTQAWNAYNAAQKAEVKLSDELLKDLVVLRSLNQSKQWEDRAYHFMTQFSVLSKRFILNYLAVEHIVCSRMQLRKVK